MADDFTWLQLCFCSQLCASKDSFVVTMAIFFLCVHVRIKLCEERVCTLGGIDVLKIHVTVLNVDLSKEKLVGKGALRFCKAS